MKQNSHQFSGDASSYQKARPGYPVELLQQLCNFWQQRNTQEPIIADIGCGTGLAAHGIYQVLQGKCKVICIEPNTTMLQQAEQTAAGNANFIFLESNAEKLPLADHSIDIAIAAQAIHYFDRPAFYHEAKRVLREDGIIAVIENNRDWRSSEFLTEYETFLEENTKSEGGKVYKRDYRMFACTAELNTVFHNATEFSTSWTKITTPEKFLELARSTTSAQRAMQQLGYQQGEQQILALAKKYADENNNLVMPYISKLYVARN